MFYTSFACLLSDKSSFSVSICDFGASGMETENTCFVNSYATLLGLYIIEIAFAVITFCRQFIIFSVLETTI